MRQNVIITALILCLVRPTSTLAADFLVLGLEDNSWQSRQASPWASRVDHRDLLVFRHPWAESEQGNFASYAREVSVPEDWKGPVHLSFYCSDDYHGVGGDIPNSLTAEGFVNHRFKRVLVNEKVVWSADVADAVRKGESPRYRIPLPVEPGETFLLSLLAFDTAPSTEILPDDFYQSPDHSTREDDPDAFRFMTHVYWGDLVLLDGKEPEMPAGAPETQSKTIEVHRERWPLPPFGDAWDSYPVSLEVSAPAGIPAQGFPLRMGIPVHAEAASELSQIRLETPDGGGFASQKRSLARWPDESLKWVLFETAIRPETTQIGFNVDRDWMAPEDGIQSDTDEEGVNLQTNRVSISAGPGDLLGAIEFDGATHLQGLRTTMTTLEGEAAGTATSSRLAEDGPLSATVLVDGRYDTLDASVATFKAYFTTFGNLPYIKLWFRIFNDTSENLAVKSLALDFDLPETPNQFGVPGKAAIDAFKLQQTSENERLLGIGGNADEMIEADSPFFVSWEGAETRGTIAVSRFRELFPKAAAGSSTGITIDLVAANDEPVVFTPGEAKSHEIWLAFGDMDPAQFAATAEQPPILQNAAYFCSTGVIGPARPHTGIPVLHEHMTTDFGEKRWEDFGQHFGVRHFPDSPYYGGLPKWSNNYYERMLNLWSEWFLSGRRAWYEMAADVCRHLMDVAIVHSEVPGKDWRGAIHGPGENHVAGPWNPNLRIAGLELFHKLTGDLDAGQDVLAVADYCVRTGAGIGGGSVRQQAGPFDAICTAYHETGDAALLDEGTERVDSVYRAMDMRRGVWPDIHGSYVYRGNVPWMDAQMGRPLYLWYRATGDVKAAQALVGLAESIVCENTDWDKPGHVYGYSHNPRFDMTAAYDLLIIPIVFAAYELTEDEFFLDAAKAQWERWKSEKQFDSPFNCYWNTPWLVWYLKEYGVE